MEEHIGETIERMLDRNARVEADKAWEQSYMRIGTIALITYASVALVLYIIGIEQFYISAIVPVIGYLLSTLSLPVLKDWWIKNHFKK
jgi:preprotein translocase subunit SecF